MDKDELLTETLGPVMRVTLNRPDRLNALSEAMCTALVQALAQAASDPSVRVVILQGSGRAFSGGGDVRQMAQDIADGRPSAYFRQQLASIHAAAIAIRNLAKPVIAVLKGGVAGAGLNLALCCDYRIAADNVVLIQAFTNIGLVPDTGGTFLLPRLIGWARATELLFEGRPVDAREAERLGLVHRVVPLAQLETAVDEVASRLAARPTRALGLTKQLLNQSADNTFDAQLAAEQSAQLTLGAESPDFLEGVRAFLEKRPPRFTGQ